MKNFFALVASLLTFVSTIVWADENPNAVASTLKEAGKPFVVTYKDGREAQLVVHQWIEPFRINLLLSDNTCMPVKGLKCELIVPTIRRRYLGVWTKHPTHAGQMIKVGRSASDDDNDEFRQDSVNVSYFITRLKGPSYERFLDIIGKDPAQHAAVLEERKNLLLARIECGSDVAQALPTNREIFYWDENFETSNNETGMTREQSQSVNQISARYEDLPFQIASRSIRISPPRRNLGVISEFFPVGITYQIQWQFQAKNLVESEDPLCAVKWDADFSQAFGQFVKFSQGGRWKPSVPAEYQPYIYQPEDENDILGAQIFQSYRWDAKEIQ